MTVPPEIQRLRELERDSPHSQRVRLSDAEQAVRDAEARVRDHYHTTGRALREIGDVLRNSTLTDSQKVSTIAAVMANGPLDDAPGGPCEDAAFDARREVREIAYRCAGAGSAAVMRLAPDVVMPAGEIGAAVEEILCDFWPEAADRPEGDDA